MTRKYLASGVAWALGALSWIPPAIVWASGAHEEMESPFSLVMRIVNFLLLAGLLCYLLNKPVRNFLTRRQQGVREALEEAQRARDEAAARYAEAQQRLAQAQKEMEELRKMLLEQGRAEKEKILANAEREAHKIRRQAETMAEQEVKKAQYILRREAVELASQMAEALLRDRIDSKDHDRILREYVETLGKTTS
jgi:F-type H+-transporting ATPase subunit b